MARRTDLNDFLRTRRARLQPEEVGLSPGLGKRRVPGLRREELAHLAGISVDYYIRLEQGRCDSVSQAVLDAVATALRLTDDERVHLHQLAKPAHTRAGAARPQKVRPGLRQLLHALPTSPAFVFGRRMDILAWNPLACALISDFAALPTRKRNLARLILLDENVKHLYPNREQVVSDTVGHLRIDAGRYPDDPELAALIGELLMHSEEFRRHWAMHTVQRKTHGVKEFRHQLFGDFTLTYETLHLPDDPDQLLTIYTAEPGSRADDNLRILATWHRGNAPATGDTRVDS
ncbi:helix-turn-helix transcriptional regulator [Nonomuraea sp. SYSU D8015]|uniref:helix-turn-helix transcriptional regulator n=1 Tax=Nonomuraea sp. SYSU D8015 TaxID=2593644 RepID=UPI001660348B|nr:helix-turn-helix transcriptional regulator [Nonomuraea sp. SYSU D8015]